MSTDLFRHVSRRAFLAWVGAAFVALRPRSARAAAPQATPPQTTAPQNVEHPDPRPGITGANVLKPNQLKNTPDLIPLFNGIREFPQLADGIRCSCGCATLPKHRSLLSCYEDPGMAMMCEVCQGQGELLVRRAREGQTLAQIRTAIDARFNKFGGSTIAPMSGSMNAPMPAPIHTSMRAIAVLAASAIALSVPTSNASAQIRASEAASVSQTLDGAVITVEYSRPRLRGRTLFGKDIAWEEVWTPGANRATLLRATRDFTINGHAVPKGVYSVWMQVREKGDWTFVLHADTMRQHFMHPKVASGVLSFPITPEHAPLTEVLTWSFPAVDADAATLALDFGPYHIPLHITVVPSMKRTISAADAQPFVGEYDVEWLWDPAHPEHESMTLHYNSADSTLRAESKMDGDPSTMLMLPVAPRVFSPLFMLAGGIGEAAETMMVEFSNEPAAATFEVRDKATDKLQARAKRHPSS